MAKSSMESKMTSKVIIAGPCCFTMRESYKVTAVGLIISGVVHFSMSVIVRARGIKAVQAGVLRKHMLDKE